MNNPTEPQSETPRTNAAKFECSPSPYEGFTAVPSALSVILEEEGNALRAQVATLTRERDDARAMANLSSIAVDATFECFEEEGEKRAALRRETEQLRAKLIEERAMAIYNGLKYQEGWVPWVVGGNSLKQGDCRYTARAAIETELAAICHAPGRRGEG